MFRGCLSEGTSVNRIPGKLRDGMWTWIGEVQTDQNRIDLVAIHDCGARFLSWATTEEFEDGKVIDALIQATKERHKECVYDRITPL